MNKDPSTNDPPKNKEAKLSSATTENDIEACQDAVQSVEKRAVEPGDGNDLNVASAAIKTADEQDVYSKIRRGEHDVKISKGQAVTQCDLKTATTNPNTNNQEPLLLDDGNGTSIYDLVEMPEPLPSPAPAASDSFSGIPGAFGISGELPPEFHVPGQHHLYRRANSVPSALAPPETEEKSEEPSTELVRASLVDLSLTENLPVAEQEQETITAAFKTQEENQTRRKQIHTRLCVLGCAAQLVAAVAIVVVVLALKSSGGESSAPADATPLANASSANATVNVLPLDRLALPPTTVHAIETDSSSPQFQAYQWLTTDFVSRSNLLPYNRTDDAQLRQRFAMATLYFATQGVNWTESGGGTTTFQYMDSSIDGMVQFFGGEWERGGPPLTANVTSEAWLSTHHECDWFSMAIQTHYPTICTPPPRPPPPSSSSSSSSSSHQSLLNLCIKKNGLIGTLPEEVFLLTDLVTLDLNRNQLEGTISPAIGGLSHLKELSFLYNQLTGSIPSEIGLLTNLKYMRFLNNDLSGSIPNELWNLSQLEMFMVDRNSGLFGSLPADLGEIMPNLTLVLIARSQWTGSLPATIGKLSNLVFWDANANQFSGTLPTELGLLTSSLQRVFLADNRLSGTLPSELGLLSNNLRDLKLSKNLNLTGTIPEEFGALAMLEKLELRGTSLSGTVPETLCGLEGLAFDCSELLCGCDCPCS